MLILKISSQDDLSISPTLNAKLARYEQFPPGWAFGRGERFSQYVLRTTKNLLSFGSSLGFDAEDVFPGRNGQLVASFYSGDDQFDIAVSPNGLRVTTELDGELVEDDKEVSFREALEELQNFGTKKKWRSYSYFSKTNTTIPSSAFEARLSSPTMTALEFQSLTGNVLARNQVASVPTPTIITGRRYPQEPPTFIFGNSIQDSYPPAQPWQATQVRAAMIATRRSAD